MKSASLPRRAIAVLALLACAFGAGSGARAADSADLEQQVRQFALGAAAAPGLRLAPCDRVEPYLPAGTRLWGRTRIGLRCTQGPTPWNVYLPLTVKVFGTGLVAVAALPVGTALAAAHLQPGEVDLADGAATLRVAEAAIGRTLARPLGVGQALHPADLRARQWFAAGDTVQITAIGPGFRVSGEGQALGPGVEGQPARVRTENGRVVVGVPVAERRLELNL